jgi:hypothetical protein
MKVQSGATCPIFLHLVQNCVSAPKAALRAESSRQKGQGKWPSMERSEGGSVPFHIAQSRRLGEKNRHLGQELRPDSPRLEQA